MDTEKEAAGFGVGLEKYGVWVKSAPAEFADKEAQGGGRDSATETLPRAAVTGEDEASAVALLRVIAAELAAIKEDFARLRNDVNKIALVFAEGNEEEAEESEEEPELFAEPEVTAEPEAVPEAQIEAEPEAVPEPQIEAEPEAVPEPVTETEIETAKEAEFEVENAAEGEPESDELTENAEIVLEEETGETGETEAAADTEAEAVSEESVPAEERLVVNADFEESEQAESEPAAETPQEPEAETPQAPVDKTQISGDFKEELKSVLFYINRLLEALPEEKIDEFAHSDQFEHYRKVFQELGIG